MVLTRPGTVKEEKRFSYLVHSNKNVAKTYFARTAKVSFRQLYMLILKVKITAITIPVTSLPCLENSFDIDVD